MNNMETDQSEPMFKFDTLLKSMFEQSAKELLKALGFNFKIEKSINPELAELGQKLIPDYLYEGILHTTEGTEPCLIHIEFQRSNDSKMIFRMGEYLFRIHRMVNTQNYKIVQFLLYFGNEKTTMRNQLAQTIGGCSLSYRFNLIDTTEMDGEDFLNDPNVEVNLLGFLCNLNRVNNLLQKIENYLSKIRNKEASEIKEYISKLIIIAELKGFSEQFMEVYEKMGFEVKLEELPLTNKIYQKGKAEGKVEGKVEGKAEGKAEDIKKILRKRFPDIDITDLEFIDELAMQQNMKKLDQALFLSIEASNIQEFKEKLNG